MSFPGFFPLLNDDIQGLLSHEVRKPQRLLHGDKIISRGTKNVRCMQGSDNSAEDNNYDFPRAVFQVHYL